MLNNNNSNNPFYKDFQNNLIFQEIPTISSNILISFSPSKQQKDPSNPKEYSNNIINLTFDDINIEDDVFLNHTNKRVKLNNINKHNNNNNSKLHFYTPSFKMIESTICLWNGCENQVFNSLLELDEHIKGQHLSNKNCLWKSCKRYDTPFYSKIELSDHIRSKHLFFKPYSCIQCNYKSINNRSLLKHQRRNHL